MIAALIRWSLQQRVLLAVICCVLLVAGLFSVKKLAVDAFPDVTNVQVQIATEAPGRPPTEVERFITVPIEATMTGLPGMVEMRSLNRFGVSLITLVFTDKTDVYFARQLVLERLMEAAQRMPSGITPVLGPVSTGLGEIYQYTLEHPSDKDAKGNYKSLTEAELRQRREIQDWVVRPMLRSVQGVADINSMGGYSKQYQISVNPNRLRYYGLTVNDVYKTVAQNNANSSGGVLSANAEQYLIRATGLIGSTEDIGNIALKEFQGVPVYVKDVANVSIGSEVRQGAILKDGQTESVAGIVQMVRGGNARDVVSRIKTRVAQINTQKQLPEGLQIVPFYDRSELVNTAMATVAKVLAEGVVLVILVLFLFLGDVRSSVIVVATLILTPLLTFFAMSRLGISANLMSLGGLAIAIGLMVDGAVVVVENTYARLADPAHAGKSRNRLIFDAASEVGKPVLYGVGIIILVFLPLLSLQGMEGKMFAPLAITIAIALAISLVLSFTLSPMLCSFILKGGQEHDTFVLRLMRKPYERMLKLCLSQPKKAIAGAIGALLLSLATVPFLGTAFIPTMQEGSITPVIVRVPKISIEESLKMETQALQAIKSVPEVKSAVSRLGRGESASDPGQPHESDPIVSLLPKDQWREGLTQDDIATEIREKLKFLPGVEVAISQPIAARVDEMVSGVRSQVAVKLFGDDLEMLRKKGDAIAAALMATKGATDLRVERVSGQEYLNVQIDRTAIARYGLNVSDVHSLIEVAIQGKSATVVYEGERRFDALVRLPLNYRSTAEEIGQLVLTAGQGALVPLANVAKLTLSDGPAQISREGAKRRLVIGVNVQGRDLGGFVAEAKNTIAKQVELGEGYTISWGGQFENMERAIGTLSLIIPITIAAIFFLLFMLFNSVRYAALVISVLPLAAIGGIFGLFISGEYLSVPAAVGFINLWGIAVLNGVVLVSFIRHQREDLGLGTEEAIWEGCKHRFRPVMMTAMVALLALIPMLFSTGPGSEVTRPLAVVVIGGLFSSTTLTLLLVPVLYRWFEEKPVEA